MRVRRPSNQPAEVRLQVQRLIQVPLAYGGERCTVEIDADRLIALERPEGRGKTLVDVLRRVHNDGQVRRRGAANARESCAR